MKQQQGAGEYSKSNTCKKCRVKVNGRCRTHEKMTESATELTTIKRFLAIFHNNKVKEYVSEINLPTGWITVKSNILK
jgi:hypothetical protein